MKIRISFYKPGGKWYSNGIIDIGNAKLYDIQEFKQAIVDNQNILGEHWPGGYHVVVTSTCENEADDNYREFFERLFFASEFHGMRRR